MTDHDDLVAELRHYSNAKLVFDGVRRYEQVPPRSHGKPRGFWVSILGEDDWPSWCRSEGFRVAHLAYEHEVNLSPDARMLVLSTPGSMVDFTVEYGKPYFPGDDYTGYAIDWGLVAGEFQGIIIPTYQWGQRLNLDWYYGWDCASGCIWDLSAIESVSLMEGSLT